MSIERQKALGPRRQEPHPVEQLIGQAQGGDRGPKTTTAGPRADASKTETSSVRSIQPAPAVKPEGSGKKAANYRIDEEILAQLKRGSLIYSAEQGKHVSQNAIVERAITEWLQNNNLWEY